MIVIRSTERLVVTAPGPQGPPGPAGGSFTFIQSSPLAAFTVTHNLHRYPNVSYIDPSGAVQIADVEHISTDVVYVQFPIPVTGKVVCS